MNKPRSAFEQFTQFLFLAAAGWLLFQFLGQQQKPSTPPRPAPALAQAFRGIDPAQGPALSKVQALDEIKKLQTQIATSPQDPLAYWSRLRVGLIQQYVLQSLASEQRSGGFLGLGAKVTVFPTYQEIIAHNAGDAVEAQAIYQSGDLLWRQGLQKGGQLSGDGAATLETLVHKGRGSSAFLDNEIFVPREIDPAKVPVDTLPPGGFRQVKVRELRGTIQNPNPQGIPDRVNQFYSTSAYYKLFDTVVNALGANPKFSYGLAILFFAMMTRLAVQPLTKRQYDSMKGMQLIAPEMKKIQDRYKGSGDQGAQVQMMKEIRALQQRHGVNPMLGCGLAVLQMPIFFVFVYPLIQHYEPKMELVGASFLWISSLARPDIVLLVLYGISMFFSFRLSSTPPADEMQAKQQQIMSLLSPVLFPFFIASYPSAFTMYWMTFNAVSTVFQWRMMKAADPKKNIIKTLMGTGLVATLPATDAVPPRPKGETKDQAKGENKSEKNGKALEAHANGSANGNAKNGTPQSASNGTVLTPLDGEQGVHNNGSSRPKKKR